MRHAVLSCACALTVALGLPAAAQRIKMTASLSDLEARAKTDSDDAAAHYNVGLAYWAANRFDDAERELSLSRTIDPQFAEPYLALAMLPYARRGSLWDDVDQHRLSDSLTKVVQESDRMYRHAFMVNPAVDLRIIGATTPPKSVFIDLIDELHDFYDYLYQGEDDMNQGKYEEAFGRWQRIINDLNGDKYPDRVPGFILFYHGLSAAHLQKYDDAGRDFQALLDRSEATERKDSVLNVPLRTNEYRYLLAVSKQDAGQLEDAVRLYREAIEHDVGLYMAHVRLAQIAESNRNWDAALVERKDAVNANPDDPSLVYDLGLTYAKAGRWSDAEGALKQAQDANPRDPRVAYYLGIVETQLEKKDAARAAFGRFIAIAPSRYAAQIQSAKQRLATLQ